MPSIFASTKVFNRPIDHQSTSIDRLKPVMTTGLVNMQIDRSIANLEEKSYDSSLLLCYVPPTAKAIWRWGSFIVNAK